MAKRCICDRASEGSPSTHHGPVHLTECEHSTLAETTRPYAPKKFRRLPGTRGLTPVLEDDDAPDDPEAY